MYSNLLFLGAIALAAINNVDGFAFKETYPDPGVIPTAKPEWLALLKDANIAKAPVLKVTPGIGKTVKSSSDLLSFTHSSLN
jgi:hypothetical protein